jgi:hypothetical protein
MTTPFNFYDETGNTVSLTGAQIVDVACQLRYQYESDVCGRAIVLDAKWRGRHTRSPIPPELVMARLDSLSRRPALSNPVPLVQSQDSVTLGAGRKEVALPVSAEGKRRLSALPNDARAGGQVNLVLEDIRVEGNPRVFYEIYVNLPESVANPVYTSPHYVGNVNFFGPSPDGPQHMKREPQIVPLTLAFLRLKETNAWSDDTVRVTFVPRALTEGRTPARLLGRATQATIGRVSVQVE